MALPRGGGPRGCGAGNRFRWGRCSGSGLAGLAVVALLGVLGSGAVGVARCGTVMAPSTTASSSSASSSLASCCAASALCLVVVSTLMCCWWRFSSRSWAWCCGCVAGRVRAGPRRLSLEFGHVRFLELSGSYLEESTVQRLAPVAAGHGPLGGAGRLAPQDQACQVPSGRLRWAVASSRTSWTSGSSASVRWRGCCFCGVGLCGGVWRPSSSTSVCFSCESPRRGQG